MINFTEAINLRHHFRTPMLFDRPMTVTEAELRTVLQRASDQGWNVCNVSPDWIGQTLRNIRTDLGSPVGTPIR